MLKQDDLKDLQKGTDRKVVLEKLGNPEKDIGSSLHIYLYNIEDGSNIVFNFSIDDKLTKATINNTDGSSKFFLNNHDNP